MGNNRNNRFSTPKECTEYLVSKGISTIICTNYGGRFKARSMFKCAIDGYEWESTLDAVRNAKATGCPLCGNVARINSINDVNDWLIENNKPIRCIKYAGTTSKQSTFYCLIDGCQWESRFYNIKNNNRGCPSCSKLKRIKEIDEVNLWLKENNNDLCCLEYCGNVRQNSKFKCNICNNVWFTSFNNIKNGNSCPHCSLSKGEKQILNVLEKNNIDYIAQYKIDDCRNILPLPFDFGIFINNSLIGLCEYQGIQHYEPIDFASQGQEWAENQFRSIQIRDNIKRTYCKSHNIPLLEIPYWEYKNIEKIINIFIKEVKQCQSVANV